MGQLRRAASSPIAPPLLVLAAYTVWALAALHLGHNIRDFVTIGRDYASRSAVSPEIRNDARYAFSSGGYDGQFFLYIARDPTHAAPYIDIPQYRYSRIGYPLVARGLALGRQGAIPYLLVAVNIVAVALTTLALALWLFRRGYSPWIALLFSFLPGTFVSVQRDLSEPLAYMLAAFALLVFDPGRVRRVALSAILFALAVLTRESAGVLAIACALSLLSARGDPARSLVRRAAIAAGYLVAIVAPYAAYRVFLYEWLGGPSAPSQAYPSAVPFGPIASYWVWTGDHLAEIYSVVAPCLIVLVVALLAVARGYRGLETTALLATLLAFLVFAPGAVYNDTVSADRSIYGIVLATVLAFPVLDRVTGGRQTWLWLATVMWYAPWGVLLPFAFNRSWA